MKLSYFSRTVGKKGEVNRLRREGKIPAILYGKNHEPMPLFIEKKELETILRNMEPGLLATMIFELHNEKKVYKALIKEVQYHPTEYAIEHVDFLLVQEDVPVLVNVPIQLIGVAECIGVKQGGFVRQVIRSLRVSCPVKQIPTKFTLDVRELNIAQVKRLSDIEVPQGARPVAKLNEVAVVIAKKV